MDYERQRAFTLVELMIALAIRSSRAVNGLAVFVSIGSSLARAGSELQRAGSRACGGINRGSVPASFQKSRTAGRRPG